MNKVTVVIPIYNCESYIEELTVRLADSLSEFSDDYEIIYVNDASPDQGWSKIIHLAENNKRLKGISLSRNFGQHAAIWAGLESASGDWIVVMDGDLQDLPEEIKTLYSTARNGYDIVLAKRVVRQDSAIKRLTSNLFYRVLAFLTDTEQNAEVGNFGIYHRRVIEAVKKMNDNIKYFPTMARWVGFKKTEVPVVHAERNGGKSGYKLTKLARLALDVILSFSDKPLILTIKLGLTISLLSFLFALVTLVRALAGHIHVSGYSSLMISIWLLAGVIITIMGMIGLYVGRIFDQVKGRPVYLVDDTVNFNG